MFKRVVVAVASFALIGLSACTLLQDRDVRLQLVTQYAVLKVIEQSSDVTAERVLAAVGRVRDVVEWDASATVAELVVKALDVLNVSDLGPADQLLVQLLVNELEVQLQARLGDGVLDADQKVLINTLLGWIEQAALMA